MDESVPDVPDPQTEYRSLGIGISREEIELFGSTTRANLFVGTTGRFFAVRRPYSLP